MITWYNIYIYMEREVWKWHKGNRPLLLSICVPYFPTFYLRRKQINFL